MSASLGVGGALGLPAAAAIADNFDWHTLFWASGGAGALATGLVLVFVPESQVRTGEGLPTGSSHVALRSLRVTAPSPVA
jgi:predicted MFS family arabinose efflux permease